jgi:uncharacterized protein (DUF488 family)
VRCDRPRDNDERVHGVETTVTHRVVYTIGHGARSADEFVALLRDGGIEHVVDVRTAPGSRRNPQFGRPALPDALGSAGIEYSWNGALGGFRKPRPDSRHVAIRNASFRGYADYMETPEFASRLEEFMVAAAQRPTAAMCAETLWWRCHRRMIADALVARGWAVVHLLGSRPQDHVLHPAARIVEGCPVYDVGEQAELDI